MDDMVEEAFDRYVNAKRSGGHYPFDDLDPDDDLESSFAMERVRRARAAFHDVLMRKPVTGEDRVLSNHLKAELHKAERELGRLLRSRASARAGHLL
jgi:hypothetical protein